MPLVIPLLGIAFNTLNAYTNALWIGSLGIYAMDWIIDPRFLLGIALFFGGWIGNLHSDTMLRNLRRDNKIGYKIPNGKLFRWVSSPNYLCEIIEWAGWAIATWSTAGLAFSIFTAANLVPRAISHHNWYRNNFKTYPSERKALIPYLL
jgi:steroid 5-alpha reductase family enzyme